MTLREALTVRKGLKYFLFCILLILLQSKTLYSQHIVIKNPEWGKWQVKNDSPIKFELLQTFGSELKVGEEHETVNFYSANSIWGIDTDEENNTYVLDIDANMIAKFSSDGKLIWKIDQRGRGPGDLENVRSLTVGNMIYVTNILGTRLDIFNLGGKFKKSINLSSINSKSKYIVGIVSERYLILKSGILGKVGINIVALDINDSFRIISEFSALDDPLVKIPENEKILSATSIVGDLIAVSRDFSYGIKYYDLHGKLIKEIKRDLPRYVRPGIYNSGERGILISLGAVFSHYEISEGFLLNYVVWPENINAPDEVVLKISQGSFPELLQRNSLDLYSDSGELLYSIENEGITPKIGRLKHSDNLGNIYTVTGKPFPQVRKYRVVIVEN